MERVTVAPPSPKAKPVAKRPVKRGIMAPVDKVVRMINLFLVNPVPIRGVAQKVTLAAQPQESVAWAENAARERRTVKFFERENVVAMPVVLEHFIKFK